MSVEEDLENFNELIDNYLEEYSVRMTIITWCNDLSALTAVSCRGNTISRDGSS